MKSTIEEPVDLLLMTQLLSNKEIVKEAETYYIVICQYINVINYTGVIDFAKAEFKKVLDEPTTILDYISEYMSNQESLGHVINMLLDGMDNANPDSGKKRHANNDLPQKSKKIKDYLCVIHN